MLNILSLKWRNFVLKDNNFTSSKIWKDSNRIRYDVNNVVNLDNVDFVIKDTEILCLQYFKIDFTENLLKLIKSSVVNGKNVIFKYIDLTEEQLILLKNWCNKNNLNLFINDEWDAPKLILAEDFSNYIKKKCTLLKRDYVKYLSDIEIEYQIFSGKSLDLWTSVLTIDKKSWKGKNLCDMKSLDREDLQYIFYLMSEPNNSSLMVAFKDNEPLAYSLWFKANDDAWYAAKWGASDSGRVVNAGIKVLFNHINYILNKQNNILNLDFWGRRSQFYDMLKNSDIRRYHFEIRGQN